MRINRFFFCVVLLVLPIANTLAKGKVRVACVGNSVTFGYGLAERETQAYPVVLQQLLGDDYDVRNFGHSGTTLLKHGHRPYVLQTEFREAMDFKADRVVIHLGLNDTDPRNWPDYADEFITDYISLIDSFRVANPNARIWICLMTPIGHRHHRFQSGTRDWHAAIQSAIRRVATNARVGLIDLHTPFYSRPDLFPDALHPDAEGAKILARTVYQALSGNYGGLQLPAIYGSGMVIQRDVPIHFNGIANADEQVEIVFNGKTHVVSANENGQWDIELPPMKAGGPYTLDFKTRQRQIHLTDVWLGEVWLCSGQSNMEFPLGKTTTVTEDLAKANNADKVHLCNMSTRYPTDAVEWESDVLDSINNLRLLKYPQWQRANAEAVKDFSAIAYHFGRLLTDSLHVHVGVICNAVGGTTTESWIDRNTLEWQFPQILYDWYHGDFGQPWARGRALKNIVKATNKLQRHPYEPCYMFEAGMLPLAHYYIKGVAWYQGESNAHNIELHERLFTLLEQSWRSYFKQPNLPFYVVQLSGLNRPSWPRFRDSQRRLSAHLPDTWLAVCHDLGDSLDVHFRNKRPLGERLACQALQHTYGFNLMADSPTPSMITTDGHCMMIDFLENEGCYVHGNELLGFDVAGQDSVYYPATSKIEGNQVYLSSPQVDVPIYVRYAWQPFTRANLMGKGGMPVSTFYDRSSLVVESLNNFPADEKGIEKGVSACYAGTIDDCLLMAGGCNFPEKPVAEGGKKRYYRGIYMACLDGGNRLDWQRVGSLPVAAAYGVSVSVSDGVICVGGCNEKESLRSVFKIKLKGKKTMIESLPSLPVPLDNFTGALQGDGLVVFGNNQVYALNITNPQNGWQLVTQTDVVRQQPVSGFVDGDYCVWGGFSPKQKDVKATLSLDGLRIHDNKVLSLSTPNNPYDGESVFLGGATAVNADSHTVVVMGGVNKDIFLEALNNPADDYLTWSPERYRFNGKVFAFDGHDWSFVGENPLLKRAGATLVFHRGTYYLIGGELKPGIRTPSVCRITLNK